MKPLIYATTYKHSKVPEEERLHKSIQGSLEAVHQKYTTDPFDAFDVVHLLNYTDIKKISDLKRLGYPVLVSALYCETDKHSTMVETKSNNKRVVKTKVLEALNQSDLVLVPGEINKTFLEKEGVLAPIKVLPLAINHKEFALKNDKEKVLFYRQFMIRKNNKYILCIGDYLNQEEMNRLIEVAGLASFAKFYFFGANYSSLLAGKYIKLAPNNIVFSTLVEDNVYRSALVNASIFLVLNENKVEATSVLEAMAAKTQIVAYLKNQKMDSFLEDKENCYLKNGINEIIDSIDQLLKGKLKTTTKKAYEYSLKYGLEKSGQQLIKLYKQVIKEKHYD